MKTLTVSNYVDARHTLADRGLAQALYDEGALIMEGVLLNLHGDAHRERRDVAYDVFRRHLFRYYEHEVFPAVLERTFAPFLAEGRADLVDLGYRITMNLTADFAGVDRSEQSQEETESLLKLVRIFSEGATLVHSTRDKEEVREEVRAALIEFDERFLQKSIARRQEALEALAREEISEDDLPRDVLTILMRNNDRLKLPPELRRREVAFYLQAGSHSTANSTVHAVHEILTWCETHPQDRARIDSDPLFLQRCAHESLRLHPASPVAWRRAICPVELASGESAREDDHVVIDLKAANRDTSIYGDDAAAFNPHRELPRGREPYGLTFGVGIHTCLGRDLDGGVLPKADCNPDTHQYGIVTLLVRAFLENDVRADPDNPAIIDTKTERGTWGVYPVLFNS